MNDWEASEHDQLNKPVQLEQLLKVVLVALVCPSDHAHYMRITVTGTADKMLQ